MRAKATHKLNAIGETSPEVPILTTAETLEDIGVQQDTDAPVPEEERNLWLRKGAAELHRGRYAMAISAYRKAAAREKLVEIGDQLIQREHYKWRVLAFRAYRLAGARDHVLANARLYPGGPIRAYIAVEACDALRVHLDNILDRPPEWHETASQLFQIYKGYRYLGGPTERILQVAERLVAHGEERLAMTAFRAAAHLRLQEENSRQDPS